MSDTKQNLHEFKGRRVEVFHLESEKAQLRAYGVKEDPNFRGFRRFIPQQHIDFYNKLPFTVLASADDNDDVWVSVATAQANKQLMHADKDGVSFKGLDKLAAHADPVWDLKPGQPIGMLGIELHTRRRNRVNGVVSRSKEGYFQLGGPLLSFGNCPQYITERNWKFREGERKEAKVTRSNTLTKDQQDLISKSTTTFIGSGHPRTGVDASHRGGPIGVFRVVDDKTIMFPDFPGNHQLKSLGNIIANGKLGMWFGDFETGNSIQLTGDAQMIWCDEAEGRKRRDTLLGRAISSETARFPDTFNWVVFKARKIIARSESLSVQWTLRNDYINLNVSKIVDEAKGVKSIYLSPIAEGKKKKGLAKAIGGQYLPIFVQPASHAYKRGDNMKPLDRTYTISAATEEYYRLTVKKVYKGKVSTYFHTDLKEGDIIQTREPQGHFVLQYETSDAITRNIDPPSTVVFISAGIGITPLVPMLKQVVEAAEAGRHKPRVIWIHGTQSPTDLPKTLHQEVESYLKRYRRANGSAFEIIRLSRSLGDATETELKSGGSERGFWSKGRLSKEVLDTILKSNEVKRDTTHFYTCGPSGFMSMLSDALTGFPHVFTESFGPSAVPKKTG